MTGICVIVGATGAMGASVARRLSAEGRRVLAIARNAEALDALASELNADRGSDVVVVPLSLIHI